MHIIPSLALRHSAEQRHMNMSLGKVEILNLMTHPLDMTSNQHLQTKRPYDMIGDTTIRYCRLPTPLIDH